MESRPIPHNGSPTSRDAAESMPPAAQPLRDLIYRYLCARAYAGATRQEIESDLMISGNTVRPRVRELIQQRLISESGETRRTPSGRKAAVLVAHLFEEVW